MYFGPKHKYTLWSTGSVADTLLAMGDSDEALRLRRREVKDRFWSAVHGAAERWSSDPQGVSKGNHGFFMVCFDAMFIPFMKFI